MNDTKYYQSRNQVLLTKKKGEKLPYPQSSPPMTEADRAFSYFLNMYEEWSSNADPYFHLRLGEEYLDSPPQAPVDGQFHFCTVPSIRELEEKISEFLERAGYSLSEFKIEVDWYNSYPGELGMKVHIHL